MMTKFFVYVLVSQNPKLRFYVGMTTDFNRRLLEHNSGKTKSTKGYLPWELFFYEEFETSKEARERGKFLKGGSGKQKIKLKWSRSSAG